TRHRRSRPGPPAGTSACRADKVARLAAAWATCCAAHWAAFLAAPPPERRSMAGSAGGSSNSGRGGPGEAGAPGGGTGPNKTISQGDLADALGSDTLNQLSRQTGMDRGDVLSELSQHLPRFVDQLTPQGRLPTEEEAARMV